MRVAGRNNIINTGKMRDYLVYQTYVQGDDGEGGKPKTWSDSFSLWAKIIPMRNTRVLEVAAVRFVKAFTIRIRYDIRIVEKNRFTFENQIYVIHGVDDIDEAHRYMQLSCYTEK